MNAAAALTFILLTVMFHQTRTFEQPAHTPTVTWPKASVRTGGSEGRIHYYAALHR